MKNRRELKVSDFYNSACQTKQTLYGFVHDKSRFTVLYDAIRSMCEALKVGGKEDAIKRVCEVIKAGYEDSWFEFDWQKPQQIADDEAVFERFINWLSYGEVLICNETVSAEIGEIVLKSRVDLIVRTKDGEKAFIIFPKKADKSPGGKSVHTCSDTDLYALTAKAALESKYPSISVFLVYLFNDSDESGNISAFVEAKTRKSNVFNASFKDCYEDGVFDEEAIGTKILSILKEKPAADCFNCSMHDLCAADTVKNMSRLPSKELNTVTVSYAMPSFTEEQKKVVNHRDGPMLVCAPPGSGKTATLVGRVKNLIDSGVPPEFILAITFTRDAAGELLNRCLSFCKRDSLPEISTIHALAMNILTSNPNLLGRKVKILSTYERYGLIERLLKEFPPIRGLNYSVLKGRNGLYATVSRYLDDYTKDRASFLEKGKVGDGFVSFAETFNEALKAHDFVSFDDLVPMALGLMEAHPEVLSGLSNRFKYVMVDEYQDVDKHQVDFIYRIARHGNLVVVGDDDQSIYAFRGGSNKYMLEFGNAFPKFTQIVFKQNFRSTDELVKSSENFIRRNKSRIPKEVYGTKRRGVAPKIVKGQDASNVDSTIRGFLDEGYSYSDIAVLATKNATLENLAREVTIPCVLGKSYLADNAVFRIILDVLSIFFEGKSDKVLVHLLTVLGVDPDFSKYPDVIDGDFSGNSTEGTYKALKFIHKCLNILKQGVSSAYISDFIFHSVKMENSAAEAAFNEMLSAYHVRDVRTLYNAMKYMAEYGDETRLEPDTSNAVLFTTSHESKGMEWRVVILVDDFKEEGSEETNRLYYVAMTRAKDRLAILTKNGQTLLTPA